MASGERCAAIGVDGDVPCVAGMTVKAPDRFAAGQVPRGGIDQGPVAVSDQTEFINQGLVQNLTTQAFDGI